MIALSWWTQHVDLSVCHCFGFVHILRAFGFHKPPIMLLTSFTAVHRAFLCHPAQMKCLNRPMGFFLKKDIIFNWPGLTRPVLSSSFQRSVLSSDAFSIWETVSHTGKILFQPCFNFPQEWSLPFTLRQFSVAQQYVHTGFMNQFKMDYWKNKVFGREIHNDLGRL